MSTCERCDDMRLIEGRDHLVGRPCDICDGRTRDFLGRPCRHCTETPKERKARLIEHRQYVNSLIDELAHLRSVTHNKVYVVVFCADQIIGAFSTRELAERCELAERPNWGGVGDIVELPVDAFPGCGDRTLSEWRR